MRLPRRLRLVLATRPLVYWTLAIALAAATAGVVQRATADARSIRQRWGETRPTLVTTRPVGLGEALGPANTAMRDIPVALRPDGALDGLPPPPAPAVATPLAAGEIVTAGRLGRAGRSPTAGLLAAGARGVAVPVPSGLLLEPGDRVDVVGATGDVAQRATVLRVADQTAVVAVTEAEAAATARAAADGDAVVVLSN